ncbi:MAM domain protein [Dictyocaulus viviparus]|uniref:MAM domain protein n=1 Tax=Dictyocaulus viviparus TaxID=29172 RepID=A0A0D8XM82_DICVI|nr:MAM domain protein [Dictyocaulus viviparus]
MVLALCQSSSIDCTFQYNLCGWASEPPWLLTDRTFLPSPLNLSPILLVGDNAFMTAQGYFGSNSTADLISPVIPPSSTLSILSFKYTKTIGDANLQVMIKEGSTYRNLDTITSNALVFWIRRTLVVPTTLKPYQIVFRASRLRTGFDVISIDDVMLRTSTKLVVSDDDVTKLTLTDSIEPRETRRSPVSYKNGNLGSTINSILQRIVLW